METKNVSQETRKEQEISIYDHFKIIKQHNQTDAVYVNTPEWVDATSYLNYTTTNPNKKLSEIVMHFYHSQEIISKSSKKIIHEKLPQLHTTIDEFTTIGFIAIDEEIYGCAKLRTIINPLHKIITINSLHDIYSDTLQLKDDISAQAIKEDNGTIGRHIFESVHLYETLFDSLMENNINSAFGEDYLSFVCNDIYKA